MAVIACEDEDQLVFAHAEVLQVIASQLSDSDLAAFGAGPLRPRFSRTLGHSAWSNGCLVCGALLGGFPLFEDFVHCQSAGITLPIVTSARIPLYILYDEPDAHSVRRGQSIEHRHGDHHVTRAVGALPPTEGRSTPRGSGREGRERERRRR
jgi:hypothetical protein